MQCSKIVTVESEECAQCGMNVTKNEDEKEDEEEEVRVIKRDNFSLLILLREWPAGKLRKEVHHLKIITAAARSIGTVTTCS